MFEVVFYETATGEKPAKAFLLALATKLRAKAFNTIYLLEANGNELREPYSKYITNGIFELRVKQSTDIVRVFYFFMEGKQIVLTNGYTKKQQELDKRELERAIQYKRDHERRHSHE